MLRTCASFRRDLSHARFTPQAAFKNPSQIFEFIGRGSLEPRPDSIERLLEREAHPPLGRHLADRLIHDSNRQSKGMSLEWDKQHSTPVFLNRRGCLEPLPLQPLAQPDRKIFAEASLVHEMRPPRSCFEQVSPQCETSFENGLHPFLLSGYFVPANFDPPRLIPHILQPNLHSPLRQQLGKPLAPLNQHHRLAIENLLQPQCRHFLRTI